MAEIGSLLRETRMRERIDITTVESATKIRAKYLRALENEEWDQLPGPTFVRTFLRTYADYLELDSKMMVEDYKQRFERPGPQDMLPFTSRSGGSRRPSRPPRGIPPFVVVGGLIVLLLVALFALGSLGGDEREPEVAATPTPRTTEVGESARRARERARERRSQRRREAAAEPKVVSLQIVPEADVYVCLEDAAGEPVLEATLSEPSDKLRSRRFRVTFGNGQVRMRVNGKTLEVPDTDGAVGYELRPGREPIELSGDELPTCA